MADVEINKGVQILLERMSSNPDEFVPDIHGKYPPKWRDIILSVYMRVEGGKDYKDQLPFLTHEEIKALWKKMQSLQGELFTKRVMNTLLRDANEFNPKDYVPTTTVPPLTYEELIGVINNLSPIQKEELSSLSRQVTGGSPKAKL
jgi:hypothetical protein